MDITVKTIPGFCAYTAEFENYTFSDFFNLETGGNILYDLLYKMQDENPDVKSPEDDSDCAYMEYPETVLPDGTKVMKYFDLVFNKGKDSETGDYRFVDVPEITAAVAFFQGGFDETPKGYEEVYKWIEDNGYEIDGPGRSIGRHGPWDREDASEYVTEIQVPIKKK